VVKPSRGNRFEEALFRAARKTVRDPLGSGLANRQIKGVVLLSASIAKAAAMNAKWAAQTLRSSPPTAPEIFDPKTPL
jgi:hypothetical protein